MKKLTIRTLALLLALLTVFPLMMSCAKNNGSETTTGSGDAAATTEPEEQQPDPDAKAALLAANPYAEAGYELIKNLIKKSYKIKTHVLYGATDNANAPALWGYGGFMEAVAEAYRLYPEDKDIADTYKDVLTKGLDGYKVSNATIKTPNNGSIKGITYYNAGKGGRGDYYYDDNAWICIQLLIGYQQLQDPALLEAAEKNLEFLWTGWDDVLGGGIYWDKTYGGKNTCSNGPVAIANLLAYQITNKDEYLEHGRMIYDWTRKVLLDGSLYNDSISKDGKNKNNWKAAYNQATPIYAGALLYEITGDETYFKQAKATMQSTVGLMFKISGSKSNQKVTVNGNPIYKAWCMGWLVRSYVKYFEVDSSKKDTYMGYVEKALDIELTTKTTAAKGYYDPYFKTGDWGSESKTDILQPSGIASCFLLAAYYDVVLNPKTAP